MFRAAGRTVSRGPAQRVAHPGGRSIDSHMAHRRHCGSRNSSLHFKDRYRITADRRLRCASVFVIALLCALHVACGGAVNRIDAYNDYAIDAARNDLWQEATLRWEQAAELGQGDARIWNNLGVAYEATERFDDALVAYRRALELDPDQASFTRNLRRAERNSARERDNPAPTNDGSDDAPKE